MTGAEPATATITSEPDPKRGVRFLKSPLAALAAQGRRMTAPRALGQVGARSDRRRQDLRVRGSLTYSLSFPASAKAFSIRAALST